ncbi:aldolase/citrate lyase family protein [Spongiactinospora sp. TRM90649]|uniref:HpcH/HpaI aldolase family protein n=1 Tax=Spongiactinospora sp. TRM90649 TaxID=3031114 RepID=UPI0023F7790D|nr:aldolase/citrate lyase family protein [Spongiactinospora sp. TRM90649]MDF5751655.1 aldolase/citrate lyase family protein [Spongiactinospora sp. TRM90649]
MDNLRQRVRTSTPLLGTLITLDSPEMALILQQAGFEWFFLDLEHSALLDLKSAQRIIEVLQPSSYAVMRLPDGSETWIKHALDTGCDGIIIPHVATAADAQRVVKNAKYPPIGRRSVGIARAHRYGSSFKEYLSSANDSVAVVAQIEEVEGVDNIDDILSVEGIDAIFVGPYDLSGSMGILGDLADADLRQKVDHVRVACREKGVPFGIFCPNGSSARAEVEQGSVLLAVGSDAGYAAAGAGAVLRELRTG